MLPCVFDIVGKAHFDLFGFWYCPGFSVFFPGDLNELLELSGQVKENGLKVVFVVSGPQACENPTLARAGETLGAKVYRDDFQELPEQLARRMYVDPEKLPLVLLISPDGTGRYASSGYNVGSIGLLLRIAGMVREEM